MTTDGITADRLPQTSRPDRSADARLHRVRSLPCRPDPQTL
jgi:hypothetical protein